MSGMKEYFDDVKVYLKERKNKNLTAANPEGWTQHTPWHWSRILKGHRIDYWPSKNKFRYMNKTYNSNVEKFIERNV